MLKLKNLKYQVAYSYRINFPIIKKAIERDNYTCVKCGLKSIDLIIHHIDESRKKDLRYINNKLDNLMTICKPCHAKIHGQNLRFSNPNISLILELRQNGKTFKNIGDYLGISRQRVHQIIRKLTP